MDDPHLKQANEHKPTHAEHDTKLYTVKVSETGTAPNNGNNAQRTTSKQHTTSNSNGNTNSNTNTNNTDNTTQQQQQQQHANQKIQPQLRREQDMNKTRTK